MGRGAPKMMDDFLIPHLDQGTFAPDLVWVDKQMKVFDIAWNHQNGNGWKPMQAEIFLSYDRFKGRKNVLYNKKYIGEAKQRFHSALRKLTRPVKQCLSKEGFKRYIIIPANEVGNNASKMSKRSILKKEDDTTQSFYPTSEESACSSHSETSAFVESDLLDSCVTETVHTDFGNFSNGTSNAVNISCDTQITELQTMETGSLVVLPVPTEQEVIVSVPQNELYGDLGDFVLDFLSGRMEIFQE